jgi:hypothetical protein
VFIQTREFLADRRFSPATMLRDIGLDGAHSGGAQSTSGRNLGRVACRAESHGDQVMNAMDGEAAQLGGSISAGFPGEQIDVAG